MKKVKTEEQKQKERDYAKARYQLTKEAKKEYREKNKEKIKEYNKNYNVKYRLENKEKIKEYNKIHQSENKEHYKEYKRKRYSENLIHRLKQTTRSFISNSFKKKNYIKKDKTVEIIGCTFDEFKTYLESKFEPWMSWDNYGNPKDGIIEPNKTWDIDHIIPLSTGITSEDIIRLNHYTNLQPLCSYYNRFVKREK